MHPQYLRFGDTVPKINFKGTFKLNAHKGTRCKHYPIWHIANGNKMYCCQICNKKHTMSEKLHFVLGDTLPTIYDTAISIFSVVTQPESKKM